MKTVKADILIIGVGSSGYGALYNALRLSSGKYRVIAVDRNPGFGGTSTFGGVNNWEPGPGGLGIHSRLASDLLNIPLAACIGNSNGSGLDERVRWGISIPCDDPYEMTLYRTNAGKSGCRRFHFEPEAMAEVMHKNTVGFSNFEVLFGTEFVSAMVKGDRVDSVVVRNLTTREEILIQAAMVLDCSADLIVSKALGCPVTKGEESSAIYGEPNAPENASETVNGITQIFRVTPCADSAAPIIPQSFRSIDVSDWISRVRQNNGPVSCFNYYPNGDINVNSLPTMEGKEYLSLGPEVAKNVCEARVYAYWNWIQEEKGFKGFRIRDISPMLGVRETFRLVGQYVLKEQDVRAGILEQERRNELVAYSDHALDTHGKTNVKGGNIKELNQPYGIPYSCLLPQGVANLLVACRGSSFSHIAASSARLCRTMMALGEAAGAAAVLGLESKKQPHEIDVVELRRVLKVADFERHIIERWELNQRRNEIK